MQVDGGDSEGGIAKRGRKGGSFRGPMRAGRSNGYRGSGLQKWLYPMSIKETCWLDMSVHGVRCV